MKVLVFVFMFIFINFTSTENLISFICTSRLGSVQRDKSMPCLSSFISVFIVPTVGNFVLNTIDDLETLFTHHMQNRQTEEHQATLEHVFETFRRPKPLFVTSTHRSGGAKRRIECLLCKSVGAAFTKSVLNGHTDEQIANTLTTLCTGLGLFTHNVCRGAVALNVPILTHIIRTTPQASANTFCGLIVQTGEDPQACPFDDPRFEWQIHLPPIHHAIRPIQAPCAEKPLKVAIITDAHIDPKYEPFGVAECNEPTCCRKGQTPASNFFSRSEVKDTVLEESISHVNGIHLLNLSVAETHRHRIVLEEATKFIFKRHEPAGYWGDYRNCDSPIWAFDDVIDNIKENHSDIDILYYIGDTVDHGVWETSYESISNSHQYLIDKIRRTFGDNVQVVPVIGNHESQPTNQYAPASITEPKLNTTWLYNSLADKWSQYLPEQAQATLRAGGDFSLLVRPGLRVISLNNNVAYKYNWWLNYDPTDAKKHLEWLVAELYHAELKGEKVHILAHIPPGDEDLTFTWTREYNKIVNRFSSTIAAEFNAHTHADEFRIFYSPEGVPINVAWGGGGIVTYSFFNLNYKIADFHPHTFEPLRIQNYVYNLTEANLTPHLRPRWYLLYDMNRSFQIKDLSPITMNNLVYSMVTHRRDLLDLYAAFNSKYSEKLWPKCDETCKVEALCKTVITVLWERRRCDELVNLFNWYSISTYV